MKIAVILIAYNQSNYIKEALDGIRLQSVEANEIIIADDGSTDDTQEIIKRYAFDYKVDKKWNLLLSSENRGINCNLQNAIDYTKSDIILIIGGDDIAMSNRVETIRDIFKNNNNITHIVTSAEIINANGDKIGELVHSDRLYTDVVAAIRNGIPNTNSYGSAFRFDNIKNFGKLPTDIPNEDGQLLFRGIVTGGLFASSVKTLKYRIHDKSASSWLRNFLSNENFFVRYISDLDTWHKNMYYWSQTLERSNHKNKDILVELARQKANFYLILKEIQSMSFKKRVKIFIEFYGVLCTREKVFTLLGKRGFLLWRKIRSLMGVI